VHNQQQYADKRAGAAGASAGTTGSTDGKAAADTQSGTVEVAGAAAVSVATATAKATIPDGLTIVAGNGTGVTTGALNVKAENNTDSTAIADGSATREGGVKGVSSSTAGVPGGDVNVTKLLGQQSETTIAVNPANHQNIIVAPNNIPGIFDATSQDSVWVSTDGGTTWTEKLIPLPTGGAASHGDPTLVFSRDGSKVVYVHMVDKTVPTPPHGNGAMGAHGIGVAVSLDGGNTWLPANTAVIGSLDADEDDDHVNDDNDKEFIAVGPDVFDTTKDRFAVTFQRRGVIYASTSPSAP